MKKENLIRRYIIFLLGLILVAFGVAFATKANLGSSPIAVIPYSLSLILPQFSFGKWTIIFSILLIVIECILLKKNIDKMEIIVQIIITFFFGYVTDFSMFCLSAFNPDIYVAKIISLLTGCMIIAIGAYLEVIADVAMLPGDAFVRAIARVSGKEFGIVRVISDVCMTVIAAVMCLVFLRELSGAREGTVIAALLIGNVVKMITPRMTKVKKFLLGEK